MFVKEFRPLLADFPRALSPLWHEWPGTDFARTSHVCRTCRRTVCRLILCPYTCESSCKRIGTVAEGRLRLGRVLQAMTMDIHDWLEAKRRSRAQMVGSRGQRPSGGCVHAGPAPLQGFTRSMVWGTPRQHRAVVVIVQGIHRLTETSSIATSHGYRRRRRSSSSTPRTDDSVGVCKDRI
jgi:hypothetical protein